MDYRSLASNIRAYASNLEETVNGISAIDFDSIWEGKSHDTMTSNLNKAITAVKAQIANARNYASALECLEDYKKNHSNIEGMINTYNASRDSGTRNRLSAQIRNAKNDNSTLSTSIGSYLDSIKKVSSQFNLINFTYNGEGYLMELTNLLSLFSNRKLSKIPDGKSLYDYYSKEEVYNNMNEIHQNYSGRDEAVNCAVGMITMAASVGKKLDYDYGGGHRMVTTLDDVAYGVDCSSFVSWAVNQGAADVFTTRTARSFYSVGSATSYANAKKGDVLVSSGHAIFIVENHPDKGYFVVAEAKGSSYGVCMSNRSYSSLRGTYQARNLDNIYKDNR